mgnify:CR=1 FL=1
MEGNNRRRRPVRRLSDEPCATIGVRVFCLAADGPSSLLRLGPGEMLKMAPSFGLTLLLVTGAASAAPDTYLRAQVFYQTGQDCNPLASAASYSVMVSINFAPVSCFPSLAFLCLAFLVPLSGSWPLILLPS